jgi:hypothetical protein
MENGECALTSLISTVATQKMISPLQELIKFHSTTGCEMMVPLDFYLGYHHMWLHKEAEEKMSFIIPFGTYYYLRMSNGLHNIGPTFCRMMKVALEEQVGRNIFSYVVDIVMVSKKKIVYIFDLTETFTNMCEGRLKLNPEKCVFEVTGGKVLKCLVSMKDIKANIDKIRDILQMQPPQIRKDV